MKQIKTTTLDEFTYSVLLSDIAGFKIDDDGKYVLFTHDQFDSAYDLQFESWIESMRAWVKYLKGIY